MKSLLLAAALVALCAVSRADDGRIHTSRGSGRLLPLPKEDGVFHFVIYGDRTGGVPAGVRVLEQAVVDTNLLGPDLVMTVGDLVQGYNQTAEWLVQMREFRGVMDRLDMAWFPVPGNHDIFWRGDGRPLGEHEASYEKHFGPLWYWFAHKKTGFLVLFTDEGDGTDKARDFSEPAMVQMSDAQLAWLAASLEEMRELKQVFVFLHHPRWMASRYKGSNWPRVHDLLVAARNVRAVFAGHIHRMHYDGKKDGIEYFALATTGGSLGEDLPAGGWLHHMNVVSVRDDSYTVATIPVGAVLDPRQFTTERWAEVDRARGVSARVTSGALEVDELGKAWGRCVARLENPCAQPLEVTLVPEGDDAAWVFSPEHLHAVIPAGEARELELAYLRRAAGFDGLRGPRLRLEKELLAGGLRITLLPKTTELTVGLGAVTDAFFVASAEHGVVFAGKAPAVRVESGDLGLDDGPFSVEAWLRLDDLDGFQSLVAKIESSEYGLSLSGGKLRFQVHLDGKYVTAASAPGAVNAGAWHHVAGVRDTAELRLYIDGRLAARVDAPGSRTRNQLPLFIGADPDKSGAPVRAVHGRMDEVRVSASARYTGDAFEPAARHAPDEATRLLLHFDAALGDWVPDHSARRAHGRLEGGAKLVPVRRRAGEGADAPRAF